jgi:hypothetical protein
VTCDSSVVSFTNKTDRHDITEILLKVALNTITVALRVRFTATDTILSSSNFSLYIVSHLIQASSRSLEDINTWVPGDRHDITEILLKVALNTITVALRVHIGEITF